MRTNSKKVTWGKVVLSAKFQRTPTSKSKTLIRVVPNKKRKYKQ